MSKLRRLITQFKPNRYDIEIDINKSDLTFQGRIVINGFKVGKPSQRITLHQKDLKILSAEVIHVSKDNQTTMEIKRINIQKSLDEVRIHFNKLIYPGNYIIKLTYSGDITKHLDGIYPSYFKIKEEKKIIIATQFESHHARQAFPCIDEPNAKAVFKLTLSSDESDVIISNTEEEKVSINNKIKTITFKETPLMSTYLLAFACGDIDFRERITESGIRLRSYATPDKKQMTGFSLEVAEKTLAFFENYFEIKYPLKKLDLLALPDFSSGAMENWGLITFRETALLINDGSNNIDAKQQIALVISHEISHQWFGNLVTMDWWDDLWLNESFANLMEYRSVDQIFPEWQIWEHFVSHEVIGAKKRDGLLKVQPIHTKVSHPDEISTLFDPSIVYSKGGSVLYMLLNFLGEDAFKMSLSNYFKKYAYKNTKSDDLWQEMSIVTGKNISIFMKEWIYSAGLPVLNINYTPGQNTINVSQDRFLLDPAEQTEDNTTIWQVPYCSNKNLRTTILTKKSTKLLIDDNLSSPLIFNQNGASYSLVNYISNDHLQDICNNLDKLSTIDKFLLLDNSYLLQRSTKIRLLTAINLISHYKKESDDIVWSSIALLFSELKRLIESSESEREKLNKLISQFVDDKIRSFDFEPQDGESSKETRYRAILLSLGATSNNEYTINKFNDLFKDFSKPTDIDPNIRSIAYYVAVKKQENFDKLLTLYKTLTDHEEKEEIIFSLATSKSENNIRRLLDLIKDKDTRSQDILSIYGSIFRNYYGRGMAWSWFKDNFEFLKELFKTDKSYGYFVRIIANYFDKDSELKDFNNFFNLKLNDISLKREIVLGTTEINNRLNWRKTNESEIKRWLKDTKDLANF